MAHLGQPITTKASRQRHNHIKLVNVVLILLKMLLTLFRRRATVMDKMTITALSGRPRTAPLSREEDVYADGSYT